MSNENFSLFVETAAPAGSLSGSEIVPLILFGSPKVVSTVELVSNVATLTTTTPHGFLVGQSVHVTGLTNTQFNGSFTIAAATGTTFSYVLVGSNLAPTVDSGAVAVIFTAQTTSAAVAALGGGPPSGPAGGDLGGSYPNPTVTSVAHVSAGVLGVAYGGAGASLSATGGASFVVCQSGVGAAFTVRQLAASDLSNGTTGTTQVVLAHGPTLTNVVTINGNGSTLPFRISSNNSSSTSAMIQVSDTNTGNNCYALVGIDTTGGLSGWPGGGIIFGGGFNGSGTNRDLVFQNFGTGSVIFAPANTNRMHIDYLGNFYSNCIAYGFYGAGPVAQQTVTGSKGGNAALASLLRALAASGLIIDSST